MTTPVKIQKAVALALASATALLPFVALAQFATAPVNLPKAFNNLNDVITKIRVVANWLLAFILVIAVIILLVGAFQYLTSAGDAEKQTAARGRIVYGLIGVAVGVVALALVNVVSFFVGGGGLTVPT